VGLTEATSNSRLPPFCPGPEEVATVCAPAWKTPNASGQTTDAATSPVNRGFFQRYNPPIKRLAMMLSTGVSIPDFQIPYALADTAG
jgi:hypothetical protein